MADALDWIATIAPDEAVRWNGAPSRGLVFRRRDLVLLPFSLLWSAGAITIGGGFRDASDGVGAVFAIVFAAVAFYAVVGRFVLDIWVRRRTTYAITDRAVYLVRRGPFGARLRLVEDDLGRAELSVRDAGRGTIRFAPERPLFTWSGAGEAWAWGPSTFAALVEVAGVHEVYALVLAVREDAIAGPCARGASSSRCSTT